MFYYLRANNDTVNAKLDALLAATQFTDGLPVHITFKLPGRVTIGVDKSGKFPQGDLPELEALLRRQECDPFARTAGTASLASDSARPCAPNARKTAALFRRGRGANACECQITRE